MVVANLMGADPTALGDRALAEGNPHLVLEGALIAAFAVGAVEAYIADADVTASSGATEVRSELAARR